MRYLLLVYSDGQDPGTETAVADGAIDSGPDTGAADAPFVAPLHAAHTATTLRVRGGRLELRDGPCVSAGERLTGMCIIAARDLNDAIRIAARLPAARHGTIEVRRVHGTAATAE